MVVSHCLILKHRCALLHLADLSCCPADGFLEAVLTFVVALPVADIWQVRGLLSLHTAALPCMHVVSSVCYAS